MRTIITIICVYLVFLPCLLIFNESDTILPNLGGFIYMAILFIIGRTKVGKIALIEVKKLNEVIERMFN